VSAWSAFAPITSALAALACYGASRHCLWTSLRRWRKAVMACAIVLSVLSPGAWLAAFGVGVGICAMLCTYMLALVILPWLALLTRPGEAASTMEHD
jgi:hypothetical protein